MFLIAPPTHLLQDLIWILHVAFVFHVSAMSFNPFIKQSPCPYFFS